MNRENIDCITVPKEDVVKALICLHKMKRTILRKVPIGSGLYMILYDRCRDNTYLRSNSLNSVQK